MWSVFRVQRIRILAWRRQISDMAKVQAVREDVFVLANKADANDLLTRLADERSNRGDDGPFVLCVLDEVVEKLNQFTKLLPKVRPYYAIKANNDPLIGKLLFKMGTGFDCSSWNEVRQALSYGATKEDIVFASTIKRTSHVRLCSEHDLPYMTFDNDEELLKLKKYYNSCKAILRLKVDDTGSNIKLSSKFGVRKEDVGSLLQKAYGYKISVVGISFHVGTGCANPMLFAKALKDAKEALVEARSIGHPASIVDIGGGFRSCQSYQDVFKKICKVISETIGKEYADLQDVKFIAEPGSFFSETSMTVVCQVIGKKLHHEGKKFEYTISDGCHGVFGEIAFGKPTRELSPRILNKEKAEGTLHESIVWGPTCDSFDQIYTSIMLPELEIGDVIAWEDMGAYSLSMASEDFGGSRKPDIIYCISKEALKHL